MNPFEPFASPILRRLLAGRDAASLAPAAAFGQGVALLVDISGFSALTSALDARGPDGAERLSQILDRSFTVIVDIIHAHGGEVLDFAGDAAIATWHFEEPENAADAALRAAACGLALQARVRRLSADAGAPLRLRIAIGAGGILSALVGGTEDRWHALVCGAAWASMVRADAAAASGDVVLAREVLAHLPAGHVAGSPVANGGLRLSRVDATPPPAAAPAAHHDQRALWVAVPRAVQQRLDAGQLGWLAEFRTITTLFASIHGLDYDGGDTLDRINGIVTALQSTVYRYGGTVNRLLADDKGTVLVAAWGVPMHTYEDNAVRAVLAAMAIREALQAYDASVSIGITTGRAFAGVTGHPERQQFALLGDPVNLAARLMQHASGRVLCDAATRVAARPRVAFGASQTLTVGRRSERVDVSEPRGLRSRDQQRGLVGRESEERILAQELTGLLADRHNRLVVIRGEPGIGKSTLVGAFMRRAAASGVRALTGTAESLDQSLPYGVWPAIFAMALGFDPDAPASVKHARLAAIADPGLMASHGPLLNSIFGLTLPATTVTAAMSSEARSSATRELLAHVLERATNGQPLAIVLEDAHWLDSASWALAAHLHRSCPALLFVVVMRPMDPGDVSDDARRLLAHDVRIIDLAVLSRDDIFALACRQLDVDDIPADLLSLLVERAEGHPLFTEQLLRTLVERGAIAVASHECRVLAPLRDVAAFPETVQGVIRSRIDLLDALEQFTLKVAGVIGRVVDLATLEHVHPFGATGLVAQLANMTSLELLVEDRHDPAHVRYTFKHAITQEVAYELLSFAQRRQLHRAAAEWFERRDDREDPGANSRLAHHWLHAGDAARALTYLERAGASAVALGHYKEAIDFLTQALNLSAAGTASAVTALQRATWRRQLGQACYSLGRLDDARRHLEAGVGEIARAVPTGAVTRTLDIAWTVASIVARSLRRGGGRPLADVRATGFHEIGMMLDTLSAICWLNQDSTGTAYCILREYDVISRVQATPQLAEAQSHMGAICNVARLTRTAEQYFTTALATADAVGTPVTRAMVLFNRAVVDVTNATWTRAIASSQEAAAIFERFREHRERRDARAIEAHACVHSGRYVEAVTIYEQVLAEARDADNFVQMGWCHLGLARAYRRQGRIADAARIAQEGLPIARAGGDVVTAVALIAVLAAASLDAGDLESAREDASAAVGIRRQTTYPSSHLLIDADTDAAETLIALTSLPDGANREEDRRLLFQVAQALVHDATVYRLARPMATITAASVAAHKGHRDKAIKEWHMAAAEARGMGMEHEAALATRLASGSVEAQARAET